MHSRDYRDIRRTLNSPTIQTLQEYVQIREKSRSTVNRVPLTKNRLRAPFVARNNFDEVILTVPGL